MMQTISPKIQDAQQTWAKNKQTNKLASPIEKNIKLGQTKK